MTPLVSPHTLSPVDKVPDMGFRPHHRRARTLSSYSSSSSVNSSRNSINPIPPVVPAVKLQRNHDTWGTFVPSTSATVSLRHLFPSPVEPPTRGEKHPRAHASEKPSPLSARPIASGLPAPRRCPSQSGVSSSASSIHEKHPELHPVLARLERGSKLCAPKTTCATCQKSGQDFPQCVRCKKMWCSRECRLVGGKRHSCN